jgi:thiamine-phosphate pyrophosphorylase
MEKRKYRIIDANFNRAGEAIRTIEEFCRFVLDSPSFSSRAKQLRHGLGNAADKIDYEKRITARDTQGDVGIGQEVADQLKREELFDCIKAGFRRFTEALRVLSEVCQTIDSPAAAELEQVRYRAYTLEKEIVEYSEPLLRFSRVKLYIVITSTLPAEVIRLVKSCGQGGADCVQLRAKDIEDDKLYELSRQFVDLCRDWEMLSIINDRPDIAIASGADGVHLGQTDLPVQQVRKLQLKPMITGKSTHGMNQLQRISEQKPTYAALGPVYSTPTKPSAAQVGLEYVRKGVKYLDGKGAGHVVIGGINLDNIDDVLEAGARCVAVCSAVCQADDPAENCRKLKAKISKFLE